jgi:hypothetical protein
MNILPFEYFGTALVSLFLTTARLGTALMITPFFGGPTGISAAGIPHRLDGYRVAFAHAASVADSRLPLRTLRRSA